MLVPGLIREFLRCKDIAAATATVTRRSDAPPFGVESGIRNRHWDQPVGGDYVARSGDAGVGFWS